jgi:serine/threonine protein kinase/predicted Zn-dependent protease
VLPEKDVFFNSLFLEGLAMVGKTISHYKILEKLGEGGMGVVYKAHDTKLNRDVALKFLPPHLTPNETEKKRFLQEAQAAARLNHPNICMVFEVGEVDGQSFIVMELVEGQMLKEKIKAGPLEVKEAVDIAVQIAEGLRKAHQKGIIHRDIKSANIMINDENQVKIMDFGLAKLAGQAGLTKTRSTAGTVAYMSPEQIEGQEVDSCSDIWSFGIVLYEMLTGQLPFKGEYESAIMYSILNEEPDQLEKYRSDVLNGLICIVNRALEKKKERRYDSIKTLISDLRTELNQFSNKVRPDLSNYQARSISTVKFQNNIQQKRVLWGFIAILGIICLFFIIQKFWKKDADYQILAILPFSNENIDPELEFICDGIPYDLIYSFSQLHSVRVRPFSSVEKYKNQISELKLIGQALKADKLVSGKITSTGNQYRIFIELIDTHANNVIWGKKYEGNTTEIVDLKNELIRDISENLKHNLSKADEEKLMKQYTEYNEAYQYYLKGRLLADNLTAEGFRKGIEFFDKSLEVDQNYALAYAGKAIAQVNVADWFISPEEAFTNLDNFAQAALKLDENLGEAHLAIALSKQYYHWDWKGAEKEFEKSIQINPNLALAHSRYAIFLSIMGQHDKAIERAKQALNLDPVSIIIAATLGEVYYWAHQFERAIENYIRVIDIDKNSIMPHLWLGKSYIELGRCNEAILEFQKTREIEDAPDIIGWMGYSYAKCGQKDKALELLRILEGSASKSIFPGYYISPYYIALIHIGLGENDQAFSLLEDAYIKRSKRMSSLKVNPMLDNLRMDPRFRVLMNKMGLYQ